MSNLSELLPAGAGAKSASFVASGTLASGVTVALKSNGQVEAVGELSQTVGSGVVYNTAYVIGQSSAYDSGSNKIVIAYGQNGSPANSYAVIGTVSGTTISFGTPVLFKTGVAQHTATAYDSSNNKIVISYRNDSNSNYGTSIVGTVSGTSISFGTPVVFESALTQFTQAVYDSSNNKIVLAFYGTSTYGRSVVGTVSGTSISFGATATFLSAAVTALGSTFDSYLNKVVVVFSQGNSYAAATVGTVSGTSISYGTPVTYQSGTVWSNAATFDSTNNKVVIAYTNNSNSYYGTALVATVSGTTISFGTPVVFASVTSYSSELGFDSNANKVNIAYTQLSATTGKLIVGTVSGTSISFGSSVDTPTSGGDTIENLVIFDSGSKKMVVSFRDVASSSGTSFVFQNVSSNNTDFVGITDEAISSAASGSVIVQGGVGTGISLPYPLIVGAPVIFEAAATYSTATVFDSNSNKVVISYRDVGNSSYGTSVVGTVSGTTITFGTPVVFNSSTTTELSSTFDSTSNKVIVSFRWGGSAPSGNYGGASVGTVSGTSITFGSIVTFSAGYTSSTATTYDSVNDKVVIAYKNDDNSGYGTAVVGTVSGTSISFGTDVVFETASVASVAATFDSANNKVVIAYKDEGNSSYGTAIIGTVSGTAISFGTAAVFEAASTTYITATFDSNANKVAIAYKDNGTTYGTAIVGTVSGTSISFGTAVVFETASTNNSTATFDSSSNRVVISYTDAGNSSHGTSIAGTISGTSISFGTPVVFEATSTTYITATFDSVNNKTVTAYQNSATYGSAVVSNIPNLLTIGTDYFVQSDGSLSTTSSTAPAGRALTTSSILLEG